MTSPWPRLRNVVLLASLLCLSLPASAASAAADPAPADVEAALKRSADWHLANPSRVEITDWVIAPFYDGLLRTALTTGDAKYLAAVLRFGQQAGWSPRWRLYHADDHAVGHAWLDVYLMDRSRGERLKPIKDRLDFVIANPATEALDFRHPVQTPGVEKTDRWTWCDALYMAPPTLARLYTITGDAKYLEFLDREFRYTYDQLYDHDEHWFYRDGSFIGKTTPGGKKVFWSRGNGWVYGGLALILEHLPKKHATRGFYENLFREMTGAVLAAQQADGLWRPSLLDPAHVPMGETSGSGFYTFGLAWGINNGLLDRAKYEPVVKRAWAGLMTRVKPDGYVGYVQQVGAAPDQFTSESKQDYGTGAFLLAGCEVLRLLGGAATVEPAKLRAQAEAIVAADKTPRAYARLVPERKDDLAWENDKVAFRIYGPALRSGPEDSGIDVWCKRVPYPVIDNWYRLDLAGSQSYHEDHGEGYDAFKVGDSRGCGGSALWIDGKVVTPDVYTRADVLWTGPDVAEFRTVYEYPASVQSRGRSFFEHHTVRLRLGERLCDVRVRFSTTPRGDRGMIADFEHEVVIGLVTQSAEATFALQPPAGIAAVNDKLGETALFTGVVIDPLRVFRMEHKPHAGEPGGVEQALVITRADARGEVNYRTGFAWAADGEITTAEQWIAYLRKGAGR